MPIKALKPLAKTMVVKNIVNPYKPDNKGNKIKFFNASFAGE